MGEADPLGPGVDGGGEQRPRGGRGAGERRRQRRRLLVDLLEHVVPKFAALDRVDADIVLAATPIDLGGLLELDKPVTRVRYELAQVDGPPLAKILAEALDARDVLTLDRRGFSTYRTRRRRGFRLVLDIERPCIDMENVGYNIEWSQELTVPQSLAEYVKASMLVELLARSGRSRMIRPAHWIFSDS